MTGNTFNIDGEVIGAAGGGIGSAGLGARINVSETGMVSGNSGVTLAGQQQVVSNDGTILGANRRNQHAGCHQAGRDPQQRHPIAEHGASIVNDAKGVIVGVTGAVVLLAEVSDSVKLVNHGTIDVTVKGAPVVALSSSNDSFVNDGTVIGVVYLGGGNDTLDMRGGSVSGKIYGNEGNDTLVIDNAKYKLSELSGEGTDKLYGGADTDIYHFATGDGKDTVMDFELRIDKLHLSDWAAISSLDDLLNNHAIDKGAGVLISAGSDSLLIKNVHNADFDALDFTPF